MITPRRDGVTCVNGRKHLWECENVRHIVRTNDDVSNCVTNRCIAPNNITSINHNSIDFASHVSLPLERCATWFDTSDRVIQQQNKNRVSYSINPYFARKPTQRPSHDIFYQQIKSFSYDVSHIFWAATQHIFLSLLLGGMENIVCEKASCSFSLSPRQRDILPENLLHCQYIKRWKMFRILAEKFCHLHTRVSRRSSSNK